MREEVGDHGCQAFKSLYFSDKLERFGWELFFFPLGPSGLPCPSPSFFLRKMNSDQIGVLRLTAKVSLDSLC